MTQHSPIKTSIQKRLEDERYVIPKEKKRRKTIFKVQYILIVSAVISLVLSLLRLLAYF